MDKNKDVAIRKRQLISQSSKKMFFWVAGASVVVGFSLVIAWFLFQQITYRSKVISAKQDTERTLDSNIKDAGILAGQIRVLETDERLQALKAKPSDKALQVILDALPADNNQLALGASLQEVLIGGAENVDLESLSVGGDNATATAGTVPGGAETIPFSAVVSSSKVEYLMGLLRRFEASIRTIDIDSIKLEQSSEGAKVFIEGHAYIMPEVTIQLTDKQVPVQ